MFEKVFEQLAPTLFDTQTHVGRTNLILCSI